jgi:hypothetical protein
MLRTLPEDHGAAAIGDYIRRARRERELAANADTGQAAYAHLKLAQHYETLVARSNDLHSGLSAANQDCGSFSAGPGAQSYFPFERRQIRARLFGSRSC